MKPLSFAITALLSGLSTISSVAFSSKVSAQELGSTNLGCTSNLRTVLGQKAPDYCTSAEANSGILFDQLKVTRNSDRSIKLDFRVFNRGSSDGLVEVYDSSGRLKDIKIIDGNRPPSGLIQSGTDLFTKVPAELFSQYPLGDSRRSLKEQNISIVIPAGGSVKITKSDLYALRYNTAMLAIEVAQLAEGDPEFAKSRSAKEFVVGFVKESVFSKDSKAAINIFKSEPTTTALFSLDFVDKEKLAQVLQQLVQYSVTVESDPSKNPFLGAFSDVTTDLGNIGIENALDKYIAPGLGTFARGVRVGGSGVNTFARAVDLFNSTASGQKATVTLRDAAKVAVASRPPSFGHGCGTGCSVHVTFTSNVWLVQTADHRSIRVASIRSQFRGAGRGNENGSSNGYVFAECSANKLAFDKSDAPPPQSGNWIKLSGNRKDYTTAYTFRGGYFDALCLGRVRSFSDFPEQ